MFTNLVKLCNPMCVFVCVRVCVVGNTQERVVKTTIKLKRHLSKNTNTDMQRHCIINN